MSLRDGITLPYSDGLCQIMQSLVKLSVSTKIKFQLFHVPSNLDKLFPASGWKKSGRKKSLRLVSCKLFPVGKWKKLFSLGIFIALSFTSATKIIQ